MTRRRRTERQRSDRGRNGRAAHPPVSPETRRGVAVVLLFAIGVVGSLAFAGVAGAAGAAIAGGLRALFGLAAYLVPLVCLAYAAILVREDRPAFSPVHLLGLLLLALALTALLHLRLGPTVSLALPTLADGGGYLGLAFALPTRALFGTIAATVLLAATAIVGVFLAFRVSFDHLRVVARAMVVLVRDIRIAILTARYRSRTEARATGAPNAPPFTTRDLPMEPAHTDGTGVETASAPRPASSPDSSVPTPASHADALVAEAQRRRRRRPRVELPLDLLSNETSKPQAADIRAAQEIIRTTLAHFGITVEMGDVSVGPTVTQFTLRPAEGVKLSRITALGNDLALALAAHPIRIEAPIPGRSLVGIEVPNEKVAVVRLREVLESNAFRTRTSNLTIALGKDVAGQVWTADLSRMPHLLVAGATGSGKSVMLNAIIVSLLTENGPDDLRLLLIDPKRVEFPVYNGIPHLLTPVITNVKKTVAALQWAIAEMDRRFECLASAQKRDLASYNATRRDDAERLSTLVIIIDELADLMAVAAAEVEGAIIRLAQMARAVGIHLIVATQRPSVDVLTGLIKANITSRIAFAVASSIDSRTILDTVGAERLVGRGDMLYVSAELSKPKRLQGAFVADQEIERIVAHLRAQEDAEYDDAITERPIVAFNSVGTDECADDEDSLLPDAKEVLIAAGKGSASLLQRRLKIGYARAARILDILEREGFIGPADGAKPRDVLVGRMTDEERQAPATAAVVVEHAERDGTL